jgi:lysophospholipase L1-like esterase
MAPVKKLFFVTVALFLGVLLALGLGEIILRFKAPGVFRLQNGRIILPVHRSYVYTNTSLPGCDARIIHHKNSLGFRGEEPPLNFANTLTVLAVGGSTTECFYLSDGRSWPERVAEDLKQDFQPVWMNNAGLDGHSTFGHSILLNDYIIPMHPKVVLFLIGLNDVGRDDLLQSDRDFLKSNRDRSGIQRLMRFFDEHSRMLSVLENLGRSWAASRKGLFHHAFNLKTAEHVTIPESQQQTLLMLHRQKYLPGYAKRLQNLIRLCLDHKIRPVLITQPILPGPGRDPQTGVNLATIQEGGQNGIEAWRVLELYNDTTRALARQNHIPLIDLAHALKKDSDYFYDMYHFTNDGAEAVAKIVFAQLDPVLKAEYPAYVRIKNASK